MYRVLVLDGNRSALNAIPIGFDVYFLQSLERNSLVSDHAQDHILIYRDKKEAVNIAARLHRDLKLDSVLCFYEFSLELAATIADSLSITGHSPDVIKRTRNKLAMREFFRDGIFDNVPFYNVLDIATDEHLLSGLSYPIVIKPIDGAGSAGVKILDNKGALKTFLVSTGPENYADYMIEQFINGTEYSVEALVLEGEIYHIELTRKFKYLNQTVEIAHQYPAIVNSSIRSAITQFVSRMIQDLKIQFGPVHTEVILSDSSEIHLVETHTRYGGDRIWLMTKDVSGFGPQEAGYFTSVGLPPIKTDTAWKSAFVYFHHGPGRITSVDLQATDLQKAEVHHEIEINTAKIHSIPRSSDDRFGFSYAKFRKPHDPSALLQMFKKIILLE